MNIYTAVALFALSFASLGIKQTSSAPVDTSRYDATRDANVTNSSSAATLDEVDTGSEEYRQTALKARSALLHLKRNAALQFRNLLNGSVINDMSAFRRQERPKLADDILQSANSCQNQRTVLAEGRRVLMLYRPWVHQLEVHNIDHVVYMHLDSAILQLDALARTPVIVADDIGSHGPINTFSLLSTLAQLQDQTIILLKFLFRCVL